MFIDQGLCVKGMTVSFPSLGVGGLQHQPDHVQVLRQKDVGEGNVLLLQSTAPTTKWKEFDFARGWISVFSNSKEALSTSSQSEKRLKLSLST